jgi:hypothetical protein
MRYKTSRSISLEHLGEHLTSAKERLSLEKKDILDSHAVPQGTSREAYAFAYLRAERVGMEAINNRLAEIAWLPMQLDPQAEVVSENRASMKRWVRAMGSDRPGADEFGNDFIHALTRSALCHGWEDIATRSIMSRIANLFRDLSCLIGMIYYTTWLAEREVEGIALTDPDDLNCSVIEIAAIVQSPELHKALRLRAEEIRKAKKQKKLESSSAKNQPRLRLIDGGMTDAEDDLLPDPLPA